jgi:hypothetical protein
MGEGYAEYCVVKREGGFATVRAFVHAPTEDRGTADGTVVKSVPTPVPDEVEGRGPPHRDGVAQSIQFD